MTKKKILVSACLLGVPCRYDGKSKPNEKVIALGEKYELVPVCPEVDGGLPTPRIPSERVGNRVLMKDGTDVSENYRRGAVIAREICMSNSVELAVMKARSPSCGKGEIYDGSFSGRLVPGNGVAAEMLEVAGVKVFTEEEIDSILT